MIVRASRRHVCHLPRSERIGLVVVLGSSFSSLIGTASSPKTSSSPRNCSLLVSSYLMNKTSLLLLFFYVKKSLIVCVSCALVRSKQASKRFKGDDKMPISKFHLVY